MIQSCLLLSDCLTKPMRPYSIRKRFELRPTIFDENLLNGTMGNMYIRKHHAETPIERIFRQVTGRRMNRMEKRYFLRKRKSKRKAN